MYTRNDRTFHNLKVLMMSFDVQSGKKKQGHLHKSKNFFICSIRAHEAHKKLI